jgi:hypothetical protein
MRARPVDNSAVNHHANGSVLAESEADLNLFENAVPVLACLLGVERLSEKDQNLVAVWCEAYEMRRSALPLIEGSLMLYVTKHQKIPKSPRYFDGMLAEKAKRQGSGTVRTHSRGGGVHRQSG